MPTKRQKGAQMERDICRIFSLWVSGGKQADCFWRTAMSGGRATMFRGVRQVGDLMAVSEEGVSLTARYFVECKFVKELDMLSFIAREAGHLYTYWGETVDQARIHKKWPLLIARQNRFPPIVLFSINDRHLRSQSPFPRVLVRDSYIVTLDELVKRKPPL